METIFFEDPFLKKQPYFSFKADLEKEVYKNVPPHWGKRQKENDEIFISGAILLENCFEGVACLETVFSDFKTFITRFLSEDKNGFTFILSKENYESEHFRLEINENECRIFAGDSEGVRRALYFIEDKIISAGGPFLKKGITERKPFIKNRITRNFFTPHEANLEFKSDEDFYSDGYLNRLAHEGINGVWVFTHLREFIPSSIVPEYGNDDGKI